MSNQTITKDSTIVGGWTPYHSLSEQDRIVFAEAMKGFVGVTYDPTSVSTQVVNGTNYRFKCNASMPPSDVIWEAIVEIYAPIGGTPVITGIQRL